ncbi:amidase family protein [Haloechinothrix sp. LS1_15]|uniref:amidase n=1 Tax=Haloechinothrix sp. LS1_15 TaxID=2652248 RepID=UPI002946908A|nr:amidase family protein [Haloechinothrix sp. LS1_15]MDV6011506.1 amidase [Haloechinothrix sp. LS1_15]
MTTTAFELAGRVRSGEVDPVELIEDTLARISAMDGRYGAFRAVLAESARAEAAALRQRDDLDRLPLAGVPVAVKDVVEVTGQTACWGSQASPTGEATDDHVLVARLRAAGAVIVGLTRVPELCIWPFSDDPEAVARNPWNTRYTAGGSSGGSGAAVASGMVPVAHGTDGLGSVRLPAALCGLVGIKPGTGVIAEPEAPSWYGMSTHGSLATTVADAALLLSVMAQRDDLAEVTEPVSPLRIAVSTRAPLGTPVPRMLRDPVTATADVLRQDGHVVTGDTPRYGITTPAGLLARWFAGPVAGSQGWPVARMQRRTRRHLAFGRAALRARLVRADTALGWQRRAREFFSDYDVLLTPTYAAPPPKAAWWHRRSWAHNAFQAIRFAPFTGPWNLAGFPAMSLPAGIGRDGVPLGVQLVAPPDGEATLLGLAAAVERMLGWQRTASEAVGS